MPISPEFLEAVLPRVARKVLGPKRPIELPALPLMRREGPVIPPQRTPHHEQLADLHKIRTVFNGKHGEGAFEESLGLKDGPRYSADGDWDAPGPYDKDAPYGSQRNPLKLKRGPFGRLDDPFARYIGEPLVVAAGVAGLAGLHELLRKKQGSKQK